MQNKLQSGNACKRSEIEFMPPINASTLRSRLVLEMASELAGEDPSLRPLDVFLGNGHPLRLSAGSNIEAMRQVCQRKVDMAIANPSSALAFAYRGRGPFDRPHPVRTITVIPSPDQYVFAVKSDLGLTTFEDIAAKRPALKVLVRGTSDHSLHYTLEDVVAAAGFSLMDLESWGGELHRVGATPPDPSKVAEVACGGMNAIFEEAAPRWVGAALDHGMTILPLSETMVQKLEAMGHRRAVLKKATFPKLPSDVLTLDFSGWPIFVLADLPDARVTQICAALEARKDVIPWQGEGPLPLAEMCRDTAAAPVSVPFHPAAERFWRERGYLA
jgi:TRAP-type uncharacterized transport system substrate-binding protein